MFRCPRAIISRLEDLLQSSSPPIPMNIRFHHPSFSHNHPADALLEFLNTTDLLQIRLVSKSTQEWADDRLPDIFSTDHYDVTVNPNGSLSTTPANLTALQSVGKYCTHLIITISSAPSATTASTLTPVSQPPSTNSNPFIPLLSRLPSLHTLTISTPSSPTNWHALSLFPPHRPLISLRIALESAPSLSNFTTLRLWPISIMGIVSLRWHGLAAWGESGWMGGKVWGKVERLEIGLFSPWCCGAGTDNVVSHDREDDDNGGRQRRRRQRRQRGMEERKAEGEGEGQDEGGGERRDTTHDKMMLKVLHDYLFSFSSTVRSLRFEWLPPPLPLLSFHNHSPAQLSIRSIRGPNPLTLHLHPTSTSTSTNSTSTSTSAPTRRDFSAPGIQWRCLREVWLSGMQVSQGEVEEVVGRAGALEKIFLREGDLLCADEEGGEGEGGGESEGGEGEGEGEGEEGGYRAECESGRRDDGWITLFAEKIVAELRRRRKGDVYVGPRSLSWSSGAGQSDGHNGRGCERDRELAGLEGVEYGEGGDGRGEDDDDDDDDGGVSDGSWEVPFILDL